MIGQKELLADITKLIEDKKFPQFSILVGEEGSGKKTLMNVIANNWKFSYTCDDVKVDTIRQMINFAYKTASTERCIFLIPDAQNMSPQARNAILKIVEEPPKSATFLMSVDSEHNLLGTIRSRGQLFRMNSYSRAELGECLSKLNQDSLDSTYILSIANNISDIIKLSGIDLDAFRKHINTIIDKADTISVGNLFKSSQQIALKGEEDKFDLKLYLQAFQEECLRRLRELSDRDEKPTKMYRDMIIETSSRMNELRVKGINKMMLYENFILNIRQIKERYAD